MNKSYDMFETWLSYTKPVMPVIVINQLEDAVPLANALFDATGIRVQRLPMTPQRIIGSKERI